MQELFTELTGHSERNNHWFIYSWKYATIFVFVLNGVYLHFIYKPANLILIVFNSACLDILIYIAKTFF